MKTLNNLIFFFFLPLYITAQTLKPVAQMVQNEKIGNSPFEEIQLFTQNTSSSFNSKLVTMGLNKSAVMLTLNKTALTKFKNNPSRFIQLNIPYVSGKIIQIDLVQVEIFSKNFTIKDREGHNLSINPSAKGIHYQGVIKGDSTSLVAISIFDNEVAGFISDKKDGNLTLGKIKNQEEHIIYQDRSIPHKELTCGTSDSSSIQVETPSLRSINSGQCKSVGIFIDCDHKMYLNLDSDQNKVTKYAVTLFAFVSTLYRNENLAIYFDGLVIHITPDPFQINNPPNEEGKYNMAKTLNNFKSFYSSWSGLGKVRHLLSDYQYYDASGIAWIGGINGNVYNKSITKVYTWDTEFDGMPNFNRVVKTMTHELGHNFGSHHTHWCGWNGGPIDNCYFSESIEPNEEDNSNCGTSPNFINCCTPGPNPGVNGGTIMSYCNLNMGISFSNGFGTQPGDKIRTTIANNPYVLPYPNSTPTDLKAFNISKTSATISWHPSISNSSFTVEVRHTNTNKMIFSTVTTATNITLTNLSRNQNYYFKVKGDCSGYSSNFSFQTEDYCLPSNFICSGNYINSVSINNIALSSNSGCPTNSNYTFWGNSAQNLPTLNRYTTNSITINKVGTSPSVKVYLDYDNDGHFESEILNEYTSNNTITVNFNIPNHSVNYQTRMRIVLDSYDWGQGSCYYAEFGEIEDYLVTIPCGVNDPNCGLVAYYPFNSNANDESGFYNNSVSNNATLTADRFGVLNKAYNFNGANSKMEFPDAKQIRPNRITVSVWINPNTTKRQMILSKAALAEPLAELYNLAYDENSKILWTIKQNGGCSTGNGWEGLTTTTSIANNVWTQVVTVFNGSEIKVYFNGFLANVYTGFASDFIDNCVGSPLKIGYHTNSDPLAFSGKIDDIRIYNRALTDSEILNLFDIETHCPRLLNLTNPFNNITTGTHSTITSAINGAITATNTISGNANVSYKAGKNILLNPGFRVENGVVFKAENGGCY